MQLLLFFRCHKISKQAQNPNRHMQTNYTGTFSVWYIQCMVHSVYVYIHASTIAFSLVFRPHHFQLHKERGWLGIFSHVHAVKVLFEHGCTGSQNNKKSYM